MANSLLDDLDALDRDTVKEEIIRAPFNYPGAKSRSVTEILKYLPYTNTYIEPFGGSGAVLLARHPSRIEVLNDRYMGIIAFYRCLRDSEKLEKLVSILELMLHSREEWLDCHATWENTNDDVERAAKWYYMISYSFSSIGRFFGRAISGKARLAGVIHNKIPKFLSLHDRLKYVQVENQDWYDCIRDYDSPETVFYIDPPYIDTASGVYKHTLTHSDHERLLATIFKCRGFCALSGYSNPFYEERDWDERYDWETTITLYNQDAVKRCGMAYNRAATKEVLWIKRAT